MRDNRLLKVLINSSRLGRVLRVDFHVAVAQVASECACRSLANVQHERYFVLTLTNHGMQCSRLLFIQLYRTATFENLNLTKVEVRVFGNHVAAARTSTAEDTAPVRVFTEHSALGEV